MSDDMCGCEHVRAHEYPHTNMCGGVCAHVRVCMPVCDSALRHEHAWGRVLCGELRVCLMRVCVLLERPVMSTHCT